MEPSIYRRPFVLPLTCLLALVFFLTAQVRGAVASEPASLSLKESSGSEFDSAFTFFPPICEVQEKMKKFLGVPYRRGGIGPRGMDCSGLTKKVFAEVFGVDLPHSSVAQSRIDGLEDVRPSKEELRTGDLLFFGPRKKWINHVGIYLANGEFLHASRSSGVTISKLSEAYWKNRLISSKRMKDIDLAAGDQEALLTARGPASAWLLDPLETREPSFELGYRGTVLPFANLNVDAFMWISSWEGGYDYGWARRTGRDPLEMDFDQTLESGNGIRLSTDLNPFQWLKITPWFTQLNDHPFAAGNDRPVRLLGLETLLVPRESKWHMAMSARAGNQEGLWGWPSDPASNAKSMDITLGLRYHFSDTLRMSLTGSRVYSELHDLQNSDWSWTPTSKTFAFRLDLRF